MKKNDNFYWEKRDQLFSVHMTVYGITKLKFIFFESVDSCNVCGCMCID